MFRSFDSDDLNVAPKSEKKEDLKILTSDISLAWWLMDAGCSYYPQKEKKSTDKINQKYVHTCAVLSPWPHCSIFS